MRRPTFLAIPIVVLFLVPAFAVEGRAQATPATQNPSAAATQAPQAPAKPELPGVRNFTRVDASFACGGALSANAVESIKQAGFRSIVNLRAASEEGANVEQETKEAGEAGLKYIWLPFTTSSPDPTKVDEFLEAVADPANRPMLIHCTSGGRVSMFWAIKRVMLDGWPVDKAMNELPGLTKNVSAPLREFALGYLKQHGK